MTDSRIETATENTDEGYRAVIYCRVSTDDKDQTNETQERVCREWCATKGMEVMEVYSDKVSGTTLDREGFGRMMTRILISKDIDYIVAYDQSRITRGDNFDEIKATIAPSRCRFRFVKMDLDSDTLPGQIVQDVMSRVNAEENRVRNEKTRLGMDTRRRAGKHIGRPARFMIAEDIESAPQGRYVPDKTVCFTEEHLMSFARQGFSLNYVAEKILNIPYSVVKNELMLANPNDATCRGKGTKDRLTTYHTLYAESKKARKGLTAERVGNEDEKTAERVVA